jgi:hypothetical protein
MHLGNATHIDEGRQRGKEHRQEKAWQLGKARQCKATRQGKQLGKARPDKARPGNAPRKGKAPTQGMYLGMSRHLG